MTQQNRKFAFFSVAFWLMAAPLAKGDSLPGTPLAGNFGTQDIVDGLNVLPGPVQPGDVVLLENPLGPLDRTNWSNIIRYFNFQTVFNGVIGIAYQISDGEAGIPRIDILDENLNAILPDTLSPNNQFINEIQVGTGTEADITTYTATGAEYNIHSDAASPENPEVFPPVPGQQIQFPGGGKGWVLYHMVEGVTGNCGPDCARLTSVKNAIVRGALAVPENEPGKPAGISDTITVAAQAGNPAFSNITLTSFPDDNDSTPAQDLEWIPAVVGDESGVSFLIEGSDVPEPTTIVLLGTALALFGVANWRRQRKSREIGSSI